MARNRNLFPLASIVISILVVGGVGYEIFKKQNPPTDIRSFTGGVMSIEGNEIELNGVFFEPNGNIPAEFSEPRDFTLRVDDGTKYEKIVTRFPSWDEIEKLPNPFRLEDLPTERMEGSFSDFTETTRKDTSLRVQADFGASIHDAENPVATRVIYRIMAMPPPPRIND